MKTSTAYRPWKGGTHRHLPYVLDGADSYANNHSVKENMRDAVTKTQAQFRIEQIHSVWRNSRSLGEEGVLSGLPGAGCTVKAPGEDSKAEGQGKNRNVWRTTKFGNSAVSIGVGVMVVVRDGKGV